MRVKLKDKGVSLLINQNLFDKLEKLVSEHNKIHFKGKNKLKLDFLVYIVDLVEKKSIELKDYLVDDHVRLKAEYFKKYCGNYKVHIDFLKKNKFISTKPYSIGKKLCIGYKIIHPKNSKANTIHCYKTKNFTFTKKLVEEARISRNKADKTTGHLTKWLDSSNIDFNYDGAIEFVKTTYALNPNKLSQRLFTCEQLKHGLINYKREGKDGRLHSSLTNLPKDLRPFLSHNGQVLVSLDIKSSQPFFLAGLLNLILENSVEGWIKSALNRRLVNKFNDVLSVTIPKTLLESSSKGLREFIELIQDKDIYDYIGSMFSSDFLLEIQKPFGNISDKYFNISKGFKERKRFKCLRDYCKKTVLEYLYCSPKSNERRIKEVRRIMPSIVNETIDLFKAESKKDKYSKNDFALILQNIEAYCVLDCITKTIAEENPELFMLTIHDNIVVTESNAQMVKKAMKDTLIGMFGICPTIHEEYWKQVCP